MLLSPSRVAMAALIALAAVALGTAGASALTQRAATPKKITAAGVGAVKLGATYAQLRAAGLVGPIGKGCELAGPNTAAAQLRAPLRGGVDFTMTRPRKVANISVIRGAAARGVGIGASVAEIKAAFPKVIPRNTDAFGIKLYIVPRRDGGRFEFGVDNDTRKVTIIGIPHIPFCD